jgi:hypothetical protein
MADEMRDVMNITSGQKYITADAWFSVLFSPEW